MIIEAEIGKRIHQYRLHNNFTLQELADKTGYSKGYLSKVEKSGKAPPVATLSVIARELGVSVSVILGEETINDSICLVRQNERKLMAKSGEEFGYAYEALANPYPNKHMEPFILTYPSDGALKHTFQHDGEEMLFVLRGQMRLNRCWHGKKQIPFNSFQYIIVKNTLLIMWKWLVEGDLFFLTTFE